MDSDNDKRRSNPALAIVATVVWGLGLIPACGLAVTSVFLFDNPHPAGNPAIPALAAVALPVLCVVAIAAVWIIWARSRQQRALWVLQCAAACLPLISIAVIAIYFTATGGAI